MSLYCSSILKICNKGNSQNIALQIKLQDSVTSNYCKNAYFKKQLNLCYIIKLTGFFFCCIKYTPCPEDIDSFSLFTDGADITQPENTAFQHSSCTLDYITIEGGSVTCTKTPTLTAHRYCGTRLSNIEDDFIAHATICGEAFTSLRLAIHDLCKSFWIVYVQHYAHIMDKMLWFAMSYISN